MSFNSASLTRRTVLGCAAASVLMPRALLAQETVFKTVKFTFAGHEFTAELYDNASARDFASLLPLDLTIDNYASNEKIAYLPRKLTEEGAGPFGNEQPGDLCYYAPWGNLAMFYAGYSYSRGLIRLGRFNGGFEPLLTRGEFPLHIEVAS